MMEVDVRYRTEACEYHLRAPMGRIKLTKTADVDRSRCPKATIKYTALPNLHLPCLVIAASQKRPLSLLPTPRFPYPLPLASPFGMFTFFKGLPSLLLGV